VSLLPSFNMITVHGAALFNHTWWYHSCLTLQRNVSHTYDSFKSKECWESDGPLRDFQFFTQSSCSVDPQNKARMGETQARLEDPSEPFERWKILQAGLPVPRSDPRSVEGSGRHMWKMEHKVSFFVGDSIPSSKRWRFLKSLVPYTYSLDSFVVTVYLIKSPFFRFTRTLKSMYRNFTPFCCRRNGPNIQMPLTRFQRNEMRNEKWFNTIDPFALLTTDQDSNLVPMELLLHAYFTQVLQD
jgi:hypothetical protein